MRPANQPDLNPRSTRTAFTLVELMVTVGIIGLLVTLLIPAISSVRNQAKVADTNALFATLTQGNEVFRGNQQIGGGYIPSATDSYASMGLPGIIDDPTQPRGNGNNVMHLSGASLLVYGLVGADGQGTPGFKDLDRTGFWFDDQHTSDATPQPGAYALDPINFEALNARQGPFVSDSAMGRVATFNTLMTDSILLAVAPVLKPEELRQKVFQDAWGRPVLYYRARRSAGLMSHDYAGSKPPGVYDVMDNRRITGVISPSASGFGGMDFGSGPKHRMDATTFPGPNPAANNIGAPAFIGTFERFIWDSKVTTKNVPVNRDTFLLVSTGKDGIYGTNDDVINWTRE